VYRWVEEALIKIGQLPRSRFSDLEVRRTPQIKVFGKGLYHKLGEE